MIEMKDSDGLGLEGMMLFSQRRGKKMRALGVVSMDESFWSANNDDEDKECRYLGISENAPVDTCDAMGSNWPAWFDKDYDGKCAMKPL